MSLLLLEALDLSTALFLVLLLVVPYLCFRVPRWWSARFYARWDFIAWDDDTQQQNKQPKLTSSPSQKSDDQKEPENVNNSISNHFLSRFSSPLTKTHHTEPSNNLSRSSSSSSNNKKNGTSLFSKQPSSPSSEALPNNSGPIADKRSAEVDDLQSRIPPERPPKRPHLRPRASSSPPPPPLLPRAQPPHQHKNSNIILNCIANNNRRNNNSSFSSNSSSSSSSSSSDADEDLELRKIEESAEELRRLNHHRSSSSNVPQLSSSNVPSPVMAPELPCRRSPSPDLPLPPPPPRPQDDEEEEVVLCGDQPLPPPPTPGEVSHLLLASQEGQLLSSQQQQPSGNNTTSRSPPISYPKNSYMTYRNEKHPGRLGFDGNYHRLSPVSKEEVAKEDKQEMESVTTSLTPSAWERWHNIGRPSATVVFNSQALKPAGVLIRDQNQHCVSSSGNQTDEVNGGFAKSSARLPRRNLSNAEANREEPTSGSSACKPVSSSSFSYGDGANRSYHHHGSQDEPTSMVYKSPIGRLGVQKGCWASLDSLTPQQQPKSSCNRESSASWPSSNRLPSVSQSLVHSSHSSLKINNSETQTMDISNCSEMLQEEQRACDATTNNDGAHKDSSNSVSFAKPTLRDQRKNSSTQTALEQHQFRNVEVMTQTTPSVAKNERLRRKEVIECDQLTKALASQLPEEDRALQVLLVPTQLKTTADYMEGLFEMESLRHTPQKQTCSRGTGEKLETSPEEIKRSPEALPADSAYFTTSESKAKFLNRYNKDVNKPIMVDIKDTAELTKRKEDLIDSIGRKLDILRAEKLAIQEEIQANQELGTSVTQLVETTAKPNELEKYKQHIEEMEKITSLLLGLSGRLARAENALMGLCNQANQEEKILEAKRDKLFEQHEEAKKLKEDIDRRSVRVSDFLSKYLSKDEYADYDHFIKMKSKLLIDSREIDEKIKLGEEQMSSLKESIEKKL